MVSDPSARTPWTWSNIERTIRVALATGAGVREFFLRPDGVPPQIPILLFVLAALGLPEALRLLAPMVRGKTE